MSPIYHFNKRIVLEYCSSNAYLLSNKLEKWLIKPSYFQKKKNQFWSYHFLFEKKIWNRIGKFRSLLENSASRRSDDFYLDFI